MNLNSYEINVDTLLIIPVDNKKSKVIEIDDSYIVNMSSLDIIKASCLFFGSSFEGRKDAIKYSTGIIMKAPILIEESRNIIFFPVSGCVHDNSIWISYQNLVRYQKIDRKLTKLYFINNVDYSINIKYNLIDNQVVRCLKLNMFLERSKNILNREALAIKNSN